MIQKTYLLFVYLLFLLQASYGEVHFVRYSTKNGLPSDKVYCATQDYAGFLWFGTDNGLVRFNGSNFKTYTVREGLPDNDVFTVFEDAQYRLWIITFKQSPCFFYKNKLHTTQNDTFLAKYFKDPDMFRFMVNRKQKRILFATATGNTLNIIEYCKVYKVLVPDARLMIKGPSFSLYSQDGIDFIYNSTQCIRILPNGRTKFSNGNFLEYNDQFTINNKSYGVGHVEKTNEFRIFRIKNDSIVVLKSFFLTSNSKGPYVNSNNEIIFVDDNGTIYELDVKTFQIRSIKIELGDVRFTTAFIDRQGNKIIGTHESGFYIFPKHGAEIVSSQVGATSLINDPGSSNFYCGFENKEILTGYKNGRLKTISLTKKSKYFSRITCVAKLNRNLLIGGDFKTMILNLDNYKSREFDIPGIYRANLNSYVKDIEIVDNDKFIVGSSNGAAIFSLSGNFTIDSIWNTRTTSVLYTNTGDIYLGTVNGLNYRPQGSKMVVKLITNSKLDRSRVTDIKIDKFGYLWVGTAQYGVFVFKNNKVQVFDDRSIPNKSLTSYYIKHIFIDSKDRIWIATDKGINLVERNGEDIRMIKKISGSYSIPNENVNSITVLGDTVYLASLSGLDRFIYNSQYLNEVPGLEITEIDYDDTIIRNTENLELQFGRHKLSIQYSVIAYQGVSGIVFRYRLKGLDDNWILTTSDRVDFISLKPGNYTFELVAFNSTTGKISKLQSFSFNVLTPWYMSMTFIFFASLFIITFLSYLVLRRIKKISKESAEENRINKQMAELEMQALRAQMNPHFIFNALSAIQNYFVTNEEIKANAYMSRFARLIRQMLDYSKDNFILLEDELSLLTNYLELEKLRFSNKLDYRIEVDPRIETNKYRLPSLLIQPLIENAINHGIRPKEGLGLVIIKFIKHEHELCIHIIDDGVGILVSEKSKLNKTGEETHNSTGMNIIFKRIEVLNKIYVTQIRYSVIDLSTLLKKESGTRITICFPLNITQQTNTN